MEVVKRDGSKQSMQFDKITNRIKALVTKEELENKELVPITVAFKLIKDTYLIDGIHTTQIDEYAAEICGHMGTLEPKYYELGGRICISNIHKNTGKEVCSGCPIKTFSETMKECYHHTNKLGEHQPLINKQFYDFVTLNKDKLDSWVDYKYDYKFDYFGFKTLERAYLLRSDTQKIIESPQDMLMRVAVALNMNDVNKGICSIDFIKETYNSFRNLEYTHATPTLFNAGTNRQQLSSCFLVSIQDSLDDIYSGLQECARISKNSGGIGIEIHDIRAKGSTIRKTNGKSDGIVPMLKVFEATARYVNQGGKRKGSIAVYLADYHADIESFLELRKNVGAETERARDLFLAVWLSDLFMKRVLEDKMWSLMCPDESRGLADVYGDEFEELYTKYESEGKFRKQIPARKLWERIKISLIETGAPYVHFKDSINRKNNQSNIGVIRTSNLCSEIMEVTNDKQTAVCNLCSIALSRFVKTSEDGSVYYDFDHLYRVSKMATINLNKVIDINYYPTEKTKSSNILNRPIGLGVQGLADTYCMMKYPFESMEARELNKKIFETIYFGSMEASCEIAMEREAQLRDLVSLWKLEEKTQVEWRQINKLKKTYKVIDEELNRDSHYGSYSSFIGSPFSKGQFQFDLWGKRWVPEDKYDEYKDDENVFTSKWNWDELREKVQRYGTRNSLLTALMPTASTSQILGNNECFEPITNNIYTRKTLAGLFTVVNKYLIRDLQKEELWDENLKNLLILNKGSIQNIDGIPDYIKKLHKTVWEIKQKTIVVQSAERGPFIDQSQSMNLFIGDHSVISRTIDSALFDGWKRGLKTGMYYLRTKPAAEAVQFSIDKTKIKKVVRRKRDQVDVVRQGEGEECLTCSA